MTGWPCNTSTSSRWCATARCCFFSVATPLGDARVPGSYTLPPMNGTIQQSFSFLFCAQSPCAPRIGKGSPGRRTCDRRSCAACTPHGRGGKGAMRMQAAAARPRVKASERTARTWRRALPWLQRGGSSGSLDPSNRARSCRTSTSSSTPRCGCACRRAVQGGGGVCV